MAASAFSRCSWNIRWSSRAMRSLFSMQSRVSTPSWRHCSRRSATESARRVSENSSAIDGSDTRSVSPRCIDGSAASTSTAGGADAEGRVAGEWDEEEAERGPAARPRGASLSSSLATSTGARRGTSSGADGIGARPRDGTEEEEEE